MTVKEFINRIVKELFEKYQESAILYEYKDNSQTHFLKILPKSIYDSVEFKELYADFISEFIDNDFEGSLCIIADDSAVTLINPDLYINSTSDSLKTVSMNNLLQKNNFNSIFLNKSLKESAINYCLAA
ncbi:MAG: hypothetical protein NTY74_04125 [Ignavibacteriae bacterium]|nr:hypothetical protein [Ignavibacteriota bacterium]